MLTFLLQAPVLLPQSFLVFDKCRINRDTCHRADLNTLRLIKMANAFGTFMGIDLIDFQPHINRLVRAFRLAHIAIDALIGDDQRHDLPSTELSKVLKLHMLLIIDAMTPADTNTLLATGPTDTNASIVAHGPVSF
ncbi:MAG: hypothetical protein ACI9I0_000518 [Rhodoferax sp.]|jgi:hypothetical protein